MEKHVKIYMEYFGYGEDDFIPSEISGNKAVDIHHIERRGMGGSEDKDYIENLIALTREEHEEFGDKKQYMDYLRSTHKEFMDNFHLMS